MTPLLLLVAFVLGVEEPASVKLGDLKVVADSSFKPTAGDFSVISRHDKATATLTPAVGFATLEGYRLATKPEAIPVMSPCVVIELKKVDNEPEAAHVIFINGPLKGRTLWTSSSSAGRFVADPKLKPSARSLPTARKRTSRAESFEEGDLMLTDLTTGPSVFSSPLVPAVSVEGRVKNLTSQPVDSWRVTVTYEDRAGQLVTTSDAILTPSPIPPGGVATFKTNDAEKPGMYAVKLEFTAGVGKTVTWIDRSGKNAKKR